MARRRGAGRCRRRRSTTRRSSRASPRRAGRPSSFVGVWDTVASVIVPRPDRLVLAEPGGARVHAAESERADVPAGDLDRRAPLHVPPEEVGRAADLQAHNRFNDAHAEPQDILQVWFAGVHADIGGGYPEKESGLSKYPLLWMIDEASKCGLARQPAHRQSARLGHPAQGQPVLLRRARRARRAAQFAARRVVAARISAEERENTRNGRRARRISATTSPTPSRALIPEGASIHASVFECIEKAVPKYRPVNMPARYETVRCRWGRRGRGSVAKPEMSVPFPMVATCTCGLPRRPSRQ